MQRFKKFIYYLFMYTWRKLQGRHSFGMFRTCLERAGKSSCLDIRAKERGSVLQLFRNATDKFAVLFRLALTHVPSLKCKPVVHGSKRFSRSLPTFPIANPLCSDSLASMPRLKSAITDKFRDGTAIDRPKFAEKTDTTKFAEVPEFHGITDIHTFNSFHSFYSFLRKTFFHTRYVLVTGKDTKKVSMPVYNLSIANDESYVIPLGIVHNCRCTVVQVRKDKYPVSNEQEAMNLGSQATAGKYQEMFMFNPGKRMTTFPAYNGYTLRKCNRCEVRPDKMKLAADIPDNEVCQACRLLQEYRNMDAKATRHKAAFLKGTKISHPEFSREIGITGKSIKEWTNQPFKHFYEKNRMLLDIENAIKETSYLGAVPYHKSDDVKWSHIFETEIQGSKAWIIVREYTWGDITLHSISDSMGEYLKEHKPIKKE